MYEEVLIKSVIKYLCSALLTEDKIGPKMLGTFVCAKATRIVINMNNI